MTRRSITRTVAVAAALFLLGSGYALAGASKADAEAAIAAAEKARAAAAEMHYEWTTTGPLIDQAKAALEAGTYDEAVTLAGQARMQGEEAVAQAKNQHETWKSAVVH